MSEQNTNLDHLMVDIETLGDQSGSVIVSLGAVQFDILTCETGETFYSRIDIDSCLKAGLKVTGSTIRFWMDKSEEARLELTRGGENLIEVLNDFTAFVEGIEHRIKKDIQIWSRGVRFDIALLTDAYQAVGATTPWPFRGERDVRTLEALRPQIYKDAALFRKYVEHLPIEDCLFQIAYCSKIWKAINP